MKPGSLVECIGTFNPNRSDTPREIVPEMGGIYTVRGIKTLNGHRGITLDEVKNEERNYTDGIGEVHFNVIGFRELQSPEEAAEIFSNVIFEQEKDLQ